MAERAELAWRWVLRGLGIVLLAATAAVDLATHQEVPIALYVLIGGLLGLPDVWGAQRALNRIAKDDK